VESYYESMMRGIDSTLHNIRVGDALTNERKSSAALRDGLDAMVRRAHDSKKNGDAGTMEDDIGVLCSSAIRSFWDASIRIGRGVYKLAAAGVGYR
jgi:hypothetical protein